jgi:hypothetical protein
MMRLVTVPFWWPTTRVPSLGWDCGASFIDLDGVAPKHEPAEEQHVGKRDNRADTASFQSVAPIFKIIGCLGQTHRVAEARPSGSDTTATAGTRNETSE